MNKTKLLSELIQEQWLNNRATSLDQKFQGNKAWSFSCEHELFVIDNDTGEIATVERTSDLIHTFGKAHGWKHKGNYAGMLPKYSCELSDNRYTQIKFDTEPHLIEIAFTYFWDLEEFHKHLSLVINSLYLCASDLNLVLKTNADVPENQSHLIEPQTDYFKGLRDFRRAIQHGDKKLTAKEANYGALIASTQIHIGGPFINSENEEDFITAMYSEEPNVIAYSHNSSPSQPRWKYYERVYGEFPLLGFPKEEKFRFKRWFENICKSPIYDEDIFPLHKNVSTISTKDYESLKIAERFKKIRDFQIIRPRVYGTLEFRADPAQENAAAIFSLLLLRLGLCGYHFYNPSKVSLVNAHNSWWKQIRTERFEKDTQVLERASIGLRSINSKNSKFLDAKGLYWDAA